MATVQDALEAIRTLLGETEHFRDDDILAVMQVRYTHLWETWNWSRRMRDFTVSTVAQVSSTASDLLTVTQGSASITSAGTPFAAAMDGRSIQIGDRDEYFTFAFLTSSTGTLQDGEGNDVLWVGDNDTEAVWRIFQTLYTLPADAASIESLAADDYRLDELDGGREQLDRMDPNRSSVDSRPIVWLYAGDTDAGLRQIELWPVPAAARVLRGQYLRDAPTLTLTTMLRVPMPVVAYATLADAYNGRYARTGDESDSRQGTWYERKYDEVRRDYAPLERERTSGPHTLGRRTAAPLGGDWLVSHQSLDAFPDR